MAIQTLNVPELDVTELPEQLYRHSQRPEWGLALLAWERNNRRAYQFEDGKLRKISKGYYDLMDPVDPEDVPATAVVANLQATIKGLRGGSERKVVKATCSFEEQLRLFTKLYPEGFQDPKWIEDKRGRAEGSSLKRHREPSLLAAREALDPSLAASLMEEGRHGELTESVLDVLAGTNLVPLSHVKALRRLDAGESAEYAEVVFHLVHGDATLQERFGRYLKVMTRLLGGRPSWRISTALLALTHPQEEVAVRRSAFIRQAGSIAPTGLYSRRPTVVSYLSFRRVAIGVRKRLEAAALPPADMLDVHDFIWTTLRKSALEHLTETA
ncbi:MAG: hypothetical protein EA422_04840 [Gemmatimonadales bacterium]|nr:MAG: hypothetical protein EA422_04840 [Gemmatimonadales bacterium]